ncbi:HAD family hydrolase [Leifsonia sp. YAF41]|uniref:HAD family hydrolase n=1 Tax=Leifsonia sp. YAF41 TaxID=3233086 RepID=UPI003F977772
MTDAVPLVVLFDLDDTLFAHRTAVAEGIVRHMQLTGGVFSTAEPAAAITLWNSLEEEHYHSYLAGRLDFQGQRRARARDFAAAHGVELGEADAGAWFDAYFDHYQDSWSLHSDAMPCLDALEQAGVRLGLITNGDLAFQQRKLQVTGLESRFEQVVASGSVGVAKPDPAIFRLACDLFGVAPASAVYVGDRLRTDAIGAAAAGLTGVWLDRHGAPEAALAASPYAESADAEEVASLGVIRVTSLLELPAVLGLPDSSESH